MMMIIFIISLSLSDSVSQLTCSTLDRLIYKK